MAWVKLDDAMPHHPKVMAAGAEAFALDVAGIAYSNRFGTDGFISDDMLPAALPCLKQPKKHAARLVAVGRWVRDDGRGGWTIHDVHDYQPTAADQEKERAEARERMRELRANRKGTKTNRSKDVRPNTSRTGAERSPDVRNPVPVPPVPSEQEPPSPSARSPRGTRLPDDWRPADEPDLIAAVGGIEAARGEYRKFRDYWQAKPGKDGRKVDWQATWRNWLRRATEDRPGSGRPKGPPRPPDGDVDYRAGWHGREATS
ncbi:MULTISPECIES: hypothetical protein [unclassified Egicoccus]|uniref:hypothetical protein n=1 Tax=unclassified Egicoccus TaxID=2635606 RepID=UPI00359DCC6B